jgi:hypothetical protein
MTLRESIEPEIAGNDEAKKRRKALLDELLAAFAESREAGVESVLQDKMGVLAEKFEETLNELETKL